MGKYNQSKSIPVFGVCVTTFPEGVAEAFSSLVKNFGNDAAYYGISWFDEEGSIKYYATTAATSQEAASLQGYETLTIEEGDYLTKTVFNWLNKTACIKDVFHDLMGTHRPQKNHPCIEWYKSDHEMLCMVKAYE